MKDKVKFLILLCFFSSCSPIPKLNIRNIENPKNIFKENNKTTYIKNIKWWEGYNDLYLNNLIEIILENNKSIEVAILNQDKAQEILNYTRGINGPDIFFNGDFKRNRLNFMDKKIADNKTILNINTIAFSGNYTIDFFGKLDALENEVKYQIEAENQKKEYVKLDIITKTINLYGYWNYLQNEQENLNKQKKIINQLYKLKNLKINLGSGIIDEVIKFQDMVINNQIAIDTNKKEQKIIENSLNALGSFKENSSIQKILSQSKNFDILKNKKTPQIISSESIVKRPDLKYYISIINSQTEKIKSLKTDFFPKIILNGELGYMAPSKQDFFSKVYLNGFLSPSIYLPILQGGRIESNYRIAGIDLNIFIEEYNDAIFQAFKNVDNNLLEAKLQKQIVDNTKSILKNHRDLFSRNKKRLEIQTISQEELLESELLLYTLILKEDYEYLSLFNKNLSLLNSLGGNYGS